ncbi:hypothetical protein ACFQZJ_00960 [Maribacter chungangensis]|uniref:Fibronectin type-III domain-containing protein n=1 Tax=Maribacter chungangensis TaxID=1069117 RepID=A0ABW3AYH7_9FLAO
MKTTYIHTILFLLLCSCTGEFSPTENAFIELKAPINKCKQGIIDPSNPNILNVDFTWQIENGPLLDGEIVLINRESEEEIRRVPIADINSITGQQATVERGNWYRWQVEAKVEGNTLPVKSNIAEFYAELIYEEAAPYPVIIREELNNSAVVQFSWESPDADPQKTFLRYVLYHTYGKTQADIAIPDLEFKKLEQEFTHSDFTKRVEIPNSEFETGSIHYFKVESKVNLRNGSSLSSNTYFKFTAK